MPHGSSLVGAVSGLITSRSLRMVRWALFGKKRRLMGFVPRINFFHGVGDPSSYLAVQLLGPLAERYAIEIIPHLVGAPDAAVAPEPERLAGWSLRDAARLAEAHGLAFPHRPVQPSRSAIEAVEAALAGVEDAAAFADLAVDLGAKLWSGAAVPTAMGSAREALAAGNLAAGKKALEKAGHYLPGVFAFEGETYWGVDRLPHLEARLAPFRRGDGPVVQQLEAGDAPGDARGAELHFYLSFRSPYTYIAAARVRRLAERHGARLVLRPVLPMVMRGLPVPLAKRMYIVRDTKREAERLGLDFGRICDPVGPGVERGLAVLHRAIALGKGPAFAESFLAGAFSEAVDATTDEGLALLVTRAGLSDADVAEALADDGWRAVAEANRVELFELGLWGVPSFRVADLPPHWGQDRLWAVEQDLRSVAGKAA